MDVDSRLIEIQAGLMIDGLPFVVRPTRGTVRNEATLEAHRGSAYDGPELSSAQAILYKCDREEARNAGPMADRRAG